MAQRLLRNQTPLNSQHRAGGIPRCRCPDTRIPYRAERAKAAAAAQEKKDAAAAAPEAVILFASQTGTAQEVARTIQAESAKHGIKSKAR